LWSLVKLYRQTDMIQVNHPAFLPGDQMADQGQYEQAHTVTSVHTASPYEGGSPSLSSLHAETVLLSKALPPYLSPGLSDECSWQKHISGACPYRLGLEAF